jgi:hypothetical protein
MCVVHLCFGHHVADKNIQVKRTIKIITEQSIMSVTLFPLSSTLCKTPPPPESLIAPLPAEAFGRDTTLSAPEPFVSLSPLLQERYLANTRRNREGADSGVEGFPLRHWSMKVVAVSADTKQDVEAEMFDKVVYNLHPSFGLKAKQSQS